MKSTMSIMIDPFAGGMLGVSSATGMYAIFMAKARGVEGVAGLLGAECGLCH
jgi:hypothetical protein